MHGRFFTTETVLTWMIPVPFKLSSWSKNFTLTSGFWSHIAPQVLTFRAGKQKMCLAQFVLIPSCTAIISGLRLLAQFHIAPQEWNLELQETKDTWIRIQKMIASLCSKRSSRVFCCRLFPIWALNVEYWSYWRLRPRPSHQALTLYFSFADSDDTVLVPVLNVASEWRRRFEVASTPTGWGKDRRLVS